MLSSRNHARNVYLTQNLWAGESRSLRRAELRNITLHLLWILGIRFRDCRLWLRSLNLWLGFRSRCSRLLCLWSAILNLWCRCSNRFCLLWLCLHDVTLLVNLHLAQNLWLSNLVLHLDALCRSRLLLLDGYRGLLGCNLLTHVVTSAYIRAIAAKLLLYHCVGLAVNLRVGRTLNIYALLMQIVGNGVQTNFELLGYLYQT